MNARPSPPPAFEERLLAAKLAPASSPAWAVKRSSLMTQLDAVSHKKMVSLVAPPGSGKTTLMAQWAGQSRVSSPAWLSLDDNDNSVHMLLRYLVAAFSRVDPGIGERARRLLAADPLSAVSVPTSLLLADIAASARPVTLMLDDIDHLTDPAAIDLLNLLVEHAPPNLSFVVAGTHARPIRPQTLLGQGALCRVDARQLRFSEAETLRLLRLAGLDDHSLAARLRQESDGWITGIRLLLSAIVDQHAGGMRPGGKRQQQDIYEFFRLSVLPRLPEAQSDFLQALSALQRFSAALADAILGRTDAAQMIEWLDAQGVFIQHMDDVGEWYRLDHLARFFFSRRLTAGQSEHFRTINIRAAYWFLGQGLWHDAVAHAMAGGAPELASQWLSQRAMGLIESSDLRSVKDCLALLPEPVVAASPALLLAQAWAHTLSLETRACTQSLQRLERLHVDGGSQTPSPSIRLEMDAIRAMNKTLMDDSEGGYRVACNVLARQPVQGSWVWRMARTAEVVGLIYRGDFSVIERLQAAVIATRKTAHEMPTYARVYMKSVLGLGYLIHGELGRAEHILKRAHLLAIETIGAESAAATLPAGYLTSVYYDWDRFDLLDALLDTHHLETVCKTAIGAAGRFAALKIRRLFQRGAPTEAMSLIDTWSKVGIQKAWPRLYLYVQSEAVRYHLSRNALNEASMAHEAMAAEWSPGADGPVGTELENWALLAQASAAIALAKGDATGVTTALEPLIDKLDALKMHQLTISPLLLLARAYQMNGEEREALDALGAALTRSAASLATRPFIDEAHRLAPLLDAFVVQRLQANPALSWFLQTLLSRLDETRHATTGDMPAAAAPRGISLTPREHEILAALCDGLSNKQMALRLDVSQETIKWHLKNIFAKLRIRSRSQAIIRGRQMLGLGDSAIKRK